MDAMIFNIQKFSLNDGPGIRTTVFFKGCPLRCAWCANPESQSFSLESGEASLSGYRRSVDKLVEVCLQDLSFYEESGGGVTISGGEPLAQPEAALELLRALRQKGIHTALESTGYAPGEVFQKVVGECDFLLMDMKHWNEEKHRQGTGVSNRQILENMAWAIRQGKEVLPRIPVIPGYNDSLKAAVELARLLREMGAGKVELLPFHQFGENKYRLLGREYAFEGQDALHPEELEEYRNEFIEGGISAFF